MSHVLERSTSHRRGACPTLEAPMQTGDGFLARLRIAGGELTPNQLRAIARLAQAHGNGLVEITARGNLQVRGLSSSTRDAFATAVNAIVTIETGLVVETSPLAGDDPFELADPRPIAAAIRTASAPMAHRLGPKVTVILDGAGRITLASLKADLRLTALDADRWTLAIGNGTAEIWPHTDALERIMAVLRQLAAVGPTARAADLAASSHPTLPQPDTPPIGRFTRRTGTALGFALPFGSAHAETLIALADLAVQHGIPTFRLAPHHALLALDAPSGFAAEVAALGLVTCSDDPRLRISACIGSDGCASGFMPARADAHRLAQALPSGTTLHVSGCAKGCAHPRRADVTLVGQTSRYGLVISGTAGDTPQSVLDRDQLESALAGLQE